MTYPLIYLKKNEDRRIRTGHLWVYSNEIDTKRSPLTDVKAGDIVNIMASNGKALGTAYIHPSLLLCARILDSNPNLPIDQAFFEKRIAAALRLRTRSFAEPYYRLVYGESDALPGLVVDRFGDSLVVQINSAGMEGFKDLIISALTHIVKPAHIVIRADSHAREIEGLPLYTETVLGDEKQLVPLTENGVQFHVPIMDGQKTGWFYDHRLNRAQLKPYVQGKRVLDLFSYIGGWGIQAACFGASEVVCIDSSAKALSQLKENALLNNVEDKIKTLEQDAFEAVSRLLSDQARFDVIIIDPPAFIKRRKDIAAGKQAYYRINELALKLLNPDGILVSASCSMHLPETDLLDTLCQLTKKSGRQARIIHQGHQGPDHPVHPAIPETAYLKSFMLFIE